MTLRQIRPVHGYQRMSANAYQRSSWLLATQNLTVCPHENRTKVPNLRSQDVQLGRQTMVAKSSRLSPIQKVKIKRILVISLGPCQKETSRSYMTGTRTILTFFPCARNHVHSTYNWSHLYGPYCQIRAFISPDPVAKRWPVGAGATEMTEFL